ncbi:MAG: VanZ family protein [Nitrospirota bacterium]
MKRIRLNIWIPPFLWMAFIFFFSTEVFSEESTGSLILPVLKALFPHASPESLENIHFFIRKMSHFTEFGILSLLWLRTLRNGWEGMPFPFYIASFILSTVYAIIDELHQSFVSVRTPSSIDVLIDSLGAASSLVLLKIFQSFRYKKPLTEEKGNGKN